MSRLSLIRAVLGLSKRGRHKIIWSTIFTALAELVVAVLVVVVEAIVLAVVQVVVVLLGIFVTVPLTLEAVAIALRLVVASVGAFEARLTATD
jgi:membrane-associated HD superfamily phosphohydrolase